MLRELFAKTLTPFLLSLVALIGLIPEVIKTVAERFATAYVAAEPIDKQAAYAAALKRCFDATLSQSYCSGHVGEADARREVQWALDSHRDEFERRHIAPVEERLRIVGAVGAGLALVWMLGRLAANLHRIVRPAFRRALPVMTLAWRDRTSNRRAGKVERDLLRFKTLHDNGLISAEEFEAKKMELKQFLEQ